MWRWLSHVIAINSFTALRMFPGVYACYFQIAPYKICIIQFPYSHFCCYVIFINTGLFKMIVGVLTTCHTQYPWDRSVCIFFYLIEQHSKFLLHTLQVLYMCTRCDFTNINMIMSSFQTVCSMSAVMVSMAVLIRTFSSGILVGRGGT